MNKMKLKDIIHGQINNIIKQKRYRSFMATYISTILIMGIQYGFIDEFSIRDQEKQNPALKLRQFIVICVSYISSTLLSFFYKKITNIDYFAQISLVFQTFILMFLQEIKYHSLDGNIIIYELLYCVLCGGQISVGNMFTAILYFRRSDGNIELVSFLYGFSFLITYFISPLSFQFKIFALSVVQCLCQILFIVYKNDFSDIDQNPENMFLTHQKKPREFGVRYHFIEKIGQGSQAQVLKYLDIQEQKFYAVKTFISSKYENYEQEKKELEILQKLKTIPNIVKVHKAVLEEKAYCLQIFLIMDLAECTLNDHITQRVKEGYNYFTNEEILLMMEQLIKALYECQSKESIQHRDIKPQNILLINKQWYLSDFGVAKQQKQNKGSLQQLEDDGLHTIIGTPAYMDPILLQNFKQIKKRNENFDFKINDYYKSDVFSLGITFLESCLLEFPLNNINQKQQILKMKLQDLRDLNIFKEGTINIITAMLEYDQQQRPNFETLLYKIIDGKNSKQKNL